MLEVNHIQITYTNFQLSVEKLTFFNGINIIKGESGSGKSSLLRCIALQEQTCQSYIYQGNQIINYNEFKKNHLTLLEQKPVFIESMKIKNHIALIEKAYHIQDYSSYM